MEKVIALKIIKKSTISNYLNRAYKASSSWNEFEQEIRYIKHIYTYTTAAPPIWRVASI